MYDRDGIAPDPARAADAAETEQQYRALRVQAYRLVDDYLREWPLGILRTPKLRPASFTGGRAILQATPAVQIICIHRALSDLLISSARVGFARYNGDPTIAKLRSLLFQLTMRHLPFTLADIEGLFRSLSESAWFWGGYVPLLHLVKHAEPLIGRSGLAPEMRAAFDRLLRSGADRSAWTTPGEREALRLMARLMR